MARIRQIKPEFFDDPDLGDISIGANLLFIGMWTLADREGRLEDNVRRLKARIFPYRDDVDVSACVGELQGKDMVRRYSVDGRAYLWIRSFTKHQRPHPKEPESVIPPCDDMSPPKHGEPCKKTAGCTDSGSLGAGSLVAGVGSTPQASVLPAVVSIAFLEFPVIGSGQSLWTLSEAQVAEWVSLFPGLDVRGEARKALAWLQASPTRRKTARGMARFLVSWLNRSVDSGRGRRYEPSAGAAVPQLGKRTIQIAAALRELKSEAS